MAAATTTRRKRYGDVQVGDGVRTVPADPGNGRLWSGVVTAARRFTSQAVIGVPARAMVEITVEVHGRSLCAEDLAHGFGYRTSRDEFRQPVYTLNYPVDAPTFRKVISRGRKVWDGKVFEPAAEEVAA